MLGRGAGSEIAVALVLAGAHGADPFHVAKHQRLGPRQIGLVDQFGGLDESVAKAAELARLDADNRGITWLERKKGWQAELAGMLRGGDDDEASEDDPFAALRAQPDRLAPPRRSADCRREPPPRRLAAAADRRHRRGA